MIDNSSDYDLNDEVFVDDDEVELRQKDCGSSTPRVRRVSDVIDSLGEGSPVHRTLMETMENDRRMSDPPKLVPQTTFSTPQRRSDGFIPTAARPNSVYDDGYGSCNAINPQAEYMTYTPPNHKKLVNDTTDARADDTVDAQPFHSSTR